MANKFDIDINIPDTNDTKAKITETDVHLLNETFHVFSKSPGSPTTSLGGARLKSGHTTTASDVWADEIPAFFNAATQAKFELFATKAVKDDLCLFNGNVYKHNGTEFVSLGTEAAVLVDGATFSKNGKEVVKFHKGRTAINLTADNNNGDGSNDYTAKIYNAATGSTTFVPQFISAMDKVVDGIPSLAYDAAVFAGGSQLAEGLTADNDYICNAYAGVIQFNKARSSGVTVNAWEYIGDKLNTTISELAAAVFGEGGSGDDDASLAQKVAQNTTAISKLNGTGDGSVAKAVADAEGRVKVTTDALAGRITQLEGIQHFSVVVVPEGQKITDVNPLVENTIYLVKEEGVAEGTYIEYIAYKSAGSETVVTEKIGSTAIDLSGYTTDAEHEALQGRVSTIETTTIPALQQAITDGVAGAKSEAATNLSTARTEITAEIAQAKSEAIASAEVTITAGTGIVVTPEGKGTTFQIAVSDDVATAAALSALSQVVASNKTELQGNIDAVAGRVTTLEGQVEALTAGENSVDKKIKTAVGAAQTTLQGNIDGVANRVTTLENTTIPGVKATAEQGVADAAKAQTAAETAAAAAKTADDKAVAAQKDASQALIDAAAAKTAGESAGATALAAAQAASAAAATADDKAVAAQGTADAAKATADTAVQSASGDSYITAEKEANTTNIKVSANISAISAAVDSALVASGTAVATAIADAKKAGTDASAAAAQALIDAKAYSDNLHTTSLDYVVLGDAEPLPTASADTLGKIYLVASQNAPTADGSAISGSYVEYMTRKVGEGDTATYTWEKIGTTAADLSAYAKAVDVYTKTQTDAAVKVAKDAADAAQTTADSKVAQSAYDKKVEELEEAIANAKPEDYIKSIGMWGNAYSSSKNATSGETDLKIKTGRSELDYIKGGIEINGNELIIRSDSFAYSQSIAQYTSYSTAAKTHYVNAVRDNIVYGKSLSGYMDTPSIIDGKDLFNGVETLTTFDSDLNQLSYGDNMFYCTSLTSFVQDMPRLTYGNDMFAGGGGFNHKLTTFIGDLSNLYSANNMFYGAYKLTTFISDLSNLNNAYNMFGDCILSTESVECIADTICSHLDSNSDNHIIYIGIANQTPNAAEIEAFNTIYNKNWKVYVNGSAYTPGAAAAVSTVDENGHIVNTPLPFYAKAVEVEEDKAEYVGQDGKFYQVLGGQFIYVSDPETYGMFSCLEDAVANMRLTKYVKPEIEA